MFGMHPRKGTIAPGSDADIVVYDPNGHTTISHATHHMNLDYSGYEGFEVSGHVDTVLSRGRVIIDGGKFLGSKSHGRFVRRELSQYLV
jgi:dihydropyrimidinase